MRTPGRTGLPGPLRVLTRTNRTEATRARHHMPWATGIPHIEAALARNSLTRTAHTEAALALPSRARATLTRTTLAVASRARAALVLTA
ncbi:hypothetical protein [Actinoplanes philippinensis]|uniref:hypothetical protein n=1 Tax=Actinoplanes philippinensis TaxID=35752 RepID=UPI0034030E5B